MDFVKVSLILFVNVRWCGANFIQYRIEILLLNKLTIIVLEPIINVLDVTLG